ncbi:hypothetical protein PENTCL1PPCAC_12366 [Pristionchus entomophagus]|uniref:Snake toxin/toxin-like domain-containing protein n=1 Tax=Pristionchus entomophagus TaxID=358040 RepID=A0AAV5T3M9_9BILA|nr:hypothetical protein PENTCL1PPCAC_12366 [Pristionchus entomophagus]
MRVVLLALLLLPFSIAIKCMVGAGTTKDNVVTSQGDCTDVVKYCYTLDSTLVGVHSITKSCDVGTTFCGKGVGDSAYNGVLGQGTVFCCQGDYCNPASSTSLLMTVLAAAAAFLWH